MVVLGVDALPQFPGRSGAVGFFRSLMQIGPKVDPSLRLIYFVTDSQKDYYIRFLDPSFADRVRFHVLGCLGGNLAARLLVQHLMVPRLCRHYGVTSHFSINPEPMFRIPGIAEVLKVAEVQSHDVPEQVGPIQGPYRRFMFERKVRRCDLIIANSRYTKERIAKWFKPRDSSVHVVYEGVDHSVFSRNDQAIDQSRKIVADFIACDAPYILFVSAFRPYKNPLPLIRAFEALVSERGVPHHLVMVGNDMRGYLAELRGMLGGAIAERIHFLDYVHHWDLPHFYRAASLMVYPSELETFGIPPLEAMACGTPVIASPYTAVPEVSGGGAWIVDPHDTAALTAAMREVLSDRRFSEELVERGMRWAMRFSWERSISEMLSLIRENQHSS